MKNINLENFLNINYYPIIKILTFYQGNKV